MILIRILLLFLDLILIEESVTIYLMISINIEFREERRYSFKEF